MTAFNGSIRKLAKGNKDFRREVATGSHSQVVLMCLRHGEEIGEEVHDDTDQIFVVVKGGGEAVLDGVSQAVGDLGFNRLDVEDKRDSLPYCELVSLTKELTGELECPCDGNRKCSRQPACYLETQDCLGCQSPGDSLA